MPGIVVGIDGSGHSERALDWALREAALRNAPVEVLTVHPVIAGYMGHGVAYPEDVALVDSARAKAQEATDQALARLGTARPASVNVQAVAGIPAEALLDAAADADMIVVGSRGAGGFARLTMGSVGDQVARHAHCPVVIIPREKEH
jgi:nucleotide-binding universal stress UspA family protein